MATPPKKIKVGDTDVAVDYADNLGRFKEGYRVSGTYQRDRIKLVKGQHPLNERATLLHELMHKLWERAGLHHHLSAKTEELVLFVLDMWLVTVLRDNPALVEYLLEGSDAQRG